MSTFDETLGALSALQTGAGLDTLRELLHVIREPRDPSRPASIEEERLAAGWRQESRPCRSLPYGAVLAADAPGVPDAEPWVPVDGPAGEWILHPAGCWVRWLVPVEAP